MGNFNLKQFWQERYVGGGNSGAGSYNVEAMLKASIINNWIKQLDIKTIQEIGCGDANNLLLYDVRMQYTGYDISEKAIQICREKTRKIRNSLMYYFGSEEKDIDYDAKMCLCLDVWYHQINDEDFEELCQKLFVKGNWEYVVIYSTDTNNQFTREGVVLAQHVRYREVQSKVSEFQDWELMYWQGGYSDNNLPSDKKMFLYRRKK